MSELQEATQIVEMTMRVGGDVVRFGVQLAAGGLHVLKNLLVALASGAQNFPAGYKTSYKKLLQEYGANLKVLQFDENQWENVQKYMKSYKIPFTEVTDLNLDDGKKEIMFPPDFADRVNSMIERTKLGYVISPEEYVAGADPVRMKEIEDEVKEGIEEAWEPYNQSFEMRETYSIDAYQAHMEDENRVRIEVTPQTIIEEEARIAIVRLPGKEDHFVAIDKDGMFRMENGNYLMFLQRDADYPIMDMEGGKVKELKGRTIERRYYDPAVEKMYRTAEELSQRETYLKSLDRELEKVSKFKHRAAYLSELTGSTTKKDASLVKETFAGDVMKGADEYAIGINKKMILSIDGTAFEAYGDATSEVPIPVGNTYMTRLPDQFDSFVAYAPADARVVDEGRTLQFQLQPTQQYAILNKDGVVKETVTGETLKKTYYSDVWRKQQREARKQKTTAAKATKKVRNNSEAKKSMLDTKSKIERK